MKLKRLFAAIMVLCLAATFLSGCAKTGSHGLDPNDPTTISIWHYYNGVQLEQFESLLMEFNETVGSEMGIVVAGKDKPLAELGESALAALQGRSDPEEGAPDMFAAYAGTAYTADQLGLVADLTDYFTEKELAEYVPEYLAEGDIDGQGSLKIFPVAKSTEVMMLNLTDWQPFADAAGVTADDLSTWEELAAAAEAYYNYTDGLTPDVPNDGKALFGRDSVANYMVVGGKQLGMEFVAEEDGVLSLDVDKEGVKRLWSNYYVPYVSGWYFSSDRYRSDDAKEGNIIACVCSTPGSTYFPKTVSLNDETSYPIESLTLPVPNFEGTDPYVVQQGAGMVVVKSDEAAEYACTVFLKWFTEQERSIAFSAGSGYLPVKESANNIEAISAAFASADDPLMPVMETAVSEINNYELYVAKPYETTDAVRAFLDSAIQNAAQQAHDEAAARIEAGEDRDGVLAEYTSDAAFDAWYESFLTGLQAAAGI